ncbi:MAG: hypothetical protein NMNS01_17450 [Nitrosomonas sp.]|nr:MAG: hypothetical protein NMNS01_17450 [Nitrosomonas sp.]
MTEITFRRAEYKASLENCHHPGLMLERGFEKWKTSNKQYNEQKKEFYNQLVKLEHNKLYESAFCRWKDYLDQTNCKNWKGEVDGRLYLGLGEANPLESSVTLHHTYGVPFIPGSAIKGVLHHALLRHYAKSYDKTKKKFILEDKALNIINVLFGRDPDTTNPHDIGDAGYVSFNDAWWIPGNLKPLAKEIVTVHHQEYYANKQPATDFDSPNPNQHVAIQGEFLFSVQGESCWSDFAIILLQQTLQNTGIGAKISSGYGFFKAGTPVQEEIKEIWPNAQLTRHTKTGKGMVVEAIYDGKKADQKWEILKNSIDNLSAASLNRLKNRSLEHSISVEKIGNGYLILGLIFEE